ncbi:hypothetical protein FP2506_17694 [Fulvimarina pelagi HTCC2506]|uniref:Uncharacterized protein n=1 Tax=Fulvimarina pelagi HTCC2506 TaxID=314231 RepID=Q0FY09_9HYPH|nr:hypothetical protein FP2506_17694 [Fulvimarina pelagi HTCC2506]
MTARISIRAVIVSTNRIVIRLIKLRTIGGA